MNNTVEPTYGVLIEKLTDRMDNFELPRAENEERFGIIHHKIDQLQDTVQNNAMVVEKLLNPSTPDRAEIYTALAKAQASIQNALQDAEADAGSYKYQYATLASVLDAVRGPLSENGIALFQITADQADGKLGIKTVLAHESGQTITDLITMAPEKHDPRGIGSIRTYMRRYAVLAICGIAGAADDDAEAATPDPSDYERINSEEIDAILALADKLFDDRADFVIQQMVEKTFDVTHVSQIKAGEAELAITRLKNTDRREKAKAKKGADAKPSPKPPKQEEREPGEDDDK